MTNDSGLVVTSHEYLPFGEDWITEGDTKNAPKYNSQELDKESGYYFYNARHYDPEIGRFVTADTVIDGELSTQGWNRFSYCKGNPIVYKDPTGHLAATAQVRNTPNVSASRIAQNTANQTAAKATNTNHIANNVQTARSSDVVRVRRVENPVSRYVNQYRDVKIGGPSSCNISVVAMFTNENPNYVSAVVRMFSRDHNITSEENLTNYIENSGYKKGIRVAGPQWNKNDPTNKGRVPTDKEFQNMRDELDKGHHCCPIDFRTPKPTVDRPYFFGYYQAVIFS